MCLLREIRRPVVDFARAARLRLTNARELIQSYAKLCRDTASRVFALTVMTKHQASNHERRSAYQVEKVHGHASCRRHEMFIARFRASVFMSPFMGEKN